MNYELAEKLKKAGFKQEPFWQVDVNAWGGSWYYLFVPEGCAQNVFADPDVYREGIKRGDILVKIPSLSELIEACGKDFLILEFMSDDGDDMVWKAEDENHTLGWGRTSEESVAQLWLQLNYKR